jgi:pellino protein
LLVVMDDRNIDSENSSIETSRSNFAVTADVLPVDDRETQYGELILLGYNGSLESTRSNSHGRRHKSKMALKLREICNGVKKSHAMEITAPPRHSKAVQDATRHVVSYAYKSHTVLVEYEPDSKKDMFQIGRSSEDQIDFTIVDTWLAAGANMVLSPAGNHMRLLKSPVTGECGQKPISSTISRYACRILADREEPNKAYVYAAGFDSSRNIFLGEKATKWQKKNGETDGLTTNGVLILHPNRHDVRFIPVITMVIPVVG